MNDTIKELIPHMYLVMAFFMSYTAIDLSVPKPYQYSTYLAVTWWALLVAVYYFIKLRNDYKKNNK